MKTAYLECGKIINTHGFRGTVKLESYCDSPMVLAGLKHLFFSAEGTEGVRVLHASVFKQFVLADLEGVTDEAAAERLRGRIVYASREELPIAEGQFFIADLLGLPVYHADTGGTLGVISDVRQQGAADLYIVDTGHGEYAIPAVPAFVIRIDPDIGVFVRPIPGLLDDGEAETV